MKERDNLQKLLDCIIKGDNQFSSYLPIEYETHWAKFYKAFDGDHTAATDLHDIVLPGWGYYGGESVFANGLVYTVFSPDHTIVEIGKGITPARAWLTTIVKAMIKRGEI